MNFDENCGCPFNGMKSCKDVRKKNGCAMYVWIDLVDANTGVQQHMYACSFVWQPFLMMKAAQETRQGAAATEDLRNQVVKRYDAVAVEPPQEVQKLTKRVM
jgi:hypothetical protein